MAAREEWALLTCLILFISGVTANKFNSITGSQLVKSTSYRNDGLTISKLHNSKSVDGTCEYAGQFLPDSFDCSIFYICFGTPLTPQQQQCPTDKRCFDPDVNQCIDDCSNCLPCTPGEELPDPENCAGYYICSDNHELVPVICGEGQFYDDVLNGCFYVVNCGIRPACHAEFEVYPDNQNCAYFYVCNANLLPVHFPCPSGNCFNNNTHSCNAVAQGCAALCIEHAESYVHDGPRR